MTLSAFKNVHVEAKRLASQSVKSTSADLLNKCQGHTDKHAGSHIKVADLELTVPCSSLWGPACPPPFRPSYAHVTGPASPGHCRPETRCRRSCTAWRWLFPGRGLGRRTGWEASRGEATNRHHPRQEGPARSQGKSRPCQNPNQSRPNPSVPLLQPQAATLVDCCVPKQSAMLADATWSRVQGCITSLREPNLHASTHESAPTRRHS